MMIMFLPLLESELKKLLSSLFDRTDSLRRKISFSTHRTFAQSTTRSYIAVI